jgi:HrpA-like RNA helicase
MSTLQVGYKVRFDRKVSKETRIVYATDGLLLQESGADTNLSESR